MPIPKAPVIPDALWRVAAVRSLQRVTVGGSLSVTANQVVFSVSKIDKRRHSPPLVIPFEEILLVGVANRTYTPFNGGFYRRLRVRAADGQDYLFVVKRPQEIAARLTGDVERARRPYA